MLAQLFHRHPSEIEKWTRSFQQTASQLGLPFGLRQKTFNTRLAQEVGLWAEEQAKGHAFHMAAFKAYFVDEQNLAQKDVLLNMAESVGLSAAEADEVIEKRTFRDAVDKDWALARELNITAVPTLVNGANKLVGDQPYEKMLRFMKNGSL